MAMRPRTIWASLSPLKMRRGPVGRAIDLGREPDLTGAAANSVLLRSPLPAAATRGLPPPSRCPAGRANESAPTIGALPNCIRSDLQAASLVGWTSRTLLELTIGIARGFIASG